MSLDELSAAEQELSPQRGEDAVRLPRLGPIGWLRWFWTQLTSMRTALFLLMLLAVASIPGSIYPQNRIDPGKVDDYLNDHPGSGPILQRLHAFDVYSSPWFSAIYLLLFISLIGCVLPRSRAHWKALRASPPRAPRRLQRMPAFRTVTTRAPAGDVLAAARTVLRKRRYRVAVHDDESVSAQRGYGSETGNLVFHLALLGILATVAAGSFLAWSGQAVVVVGDGFANTLPQYDDFSPGRAVNTENLPPFSLNLTGMQVKFDSTSTGNQFGAAREFRADVQYRKSPSSPAQTKAITVNHPLHVDGAKIYLVGNGYAPSITVRDSKGDVVASGPLPFVATDAQYTSNGVVKAPDAEPAGIGLRAILLPDAALTSTGQPVSVFPDDKNPKLIFTAYTGDLGLNDGVPQSVYSLDLTHLTQLTQNGQPYSDILAIGQTAKLPNGTGTVTFNGVQRYAALDVRYDPTKYLVLFFALAALAGVTASLFVRRRRVWVRAIADGRGRTLVQVAGLARTEDAGLDDEISAVLLAAVPVGSGPPDHSDPPAEASAQPPGGRSGPDGEDAETAETAVVVVPAAKEPAAPAASTGSRAPTGSTATKAAPAGE